MTELVRPGGAEHARRALFAHDEYRDPDTGISMVRLSFENLQDPGRSIRAEIATGFGANMTSLRYGDQELIHTDYDALKSLQRDEKKLTGCFVLWPFPNDVPFLADGLVFDRPFGNLELQSHPDGLSVTSHTIINRQDELYQYFPHESKLSVTHKISENGVKVRYLAENHSLAPMPSGFGMHPLFNLLDGREGTRICIPAPAMLEKNNNGLPTGRKIDVSEDPAHDLRQPRSVAELAIDDTWTDLRSGRRPFIEYADTGIRVEMQSDTGDFPYYVAFTPPPEVGEYVCLKPQSVPPNALGGRRTELPVAPAAVVPINESRGGEFSFILSRT